VIEVFAEVEAQLAATQAKVSEQESALDEQESALDSATAKVQLLKKQQKLDRAAINKLETELKSLAHNESTKSSNLSLIAFNDSASERQSPMIGSTNDPEIEVVELLDEIAHGDDEIRVHQVGQRLSREFTKSGRDFHVNSPRLLCTA